MSAIVLLRSFDAIVRDYAARFRDRQRREGRWFAVQTSLEDAIEKAAMAIGPSGKRLNHQRRIPEAVLRAWTDSLLERRERLRRLSPEEIEDVLCIYKRDIAAIATSTVSPTTKPRGC